MATKKRTSNEAFGGNKDLSSSFGYNEVTSPNSHEVGRISNALNTNIAIRKQLNLFDYLDNDEQREKLSLSDEAHYIDRRGKTISLSVEEIQIVKALSSYLPFNDPELRAYITAINTMDAKGVLKETPKAPIQLPVSLLQLCKDIKGDTKEASLKRIAQLLTRLEEVEQVQYFNVNGERYSVVRPLIRFNEKIYKHYSEIRSSKGRRKAQDPETKEERILVGANIIYSSLFLYEAANKYCPLYTTKLFEVWRGNKTEIFAILLSDLESKWRQYYLNSIKAEKAAKIANKELKATDKDEYKRLVEEAKLKALVYKSSTFTIRDRVTTDYETNRMQRSRFIPDLQRAINSLVEYGIITAHSHIAKDNSNAIFVYNPHFVPKEELHLLPPEDTEK